MVFQAGVISKWTNDSQRFLLEHFDTIYDSPSHIYHSALPLSPSSSWLREYYSAELPLMVKVIKGLPAEWGKCSRTVLLESLPQSLSYHNNIIAVGSKHGNITLLSAITGSQTGILSGHVRSVVSLTFSLDGTLLVSGSQDCTVKLWDIQTGGVIKTFFHDDRIYSVSISADCTRIASGSGMKICLWNIQTGGCYHTTRQQGFVTQVCFSPTNPQYLLSISSGEVWQWDISSHQTKLLFDGDWVAFSPDGTQFLSCDGGAITVQNSDSGMVVAKFKHPKNYIKYCCFSPSGRLVAGAVGDTAHIWDITNPNPHIVRTFIGHTKRITSLVFFSPTSLITASDDTLVRIWQIGTPSTNPVITDPDPASIISAPIWCIALQVKDGITITSDSDGVIKTWDILTGLCKASYQTPAKGTGHRDAQLIDGRLICVWYDNEIIHMWDTEKGELWKVDRKSMYVPLDLKISVDRSKIFCLDGYSMQTYSMQTGEVMNRLEFERGGDYVSLIVDSSRVWMYTPNQEYRGLDFEIPGSLPVQFHNVPPHKLHPDGAMLWDVNLCGIRDQDTRKVVFQLSGGFGKPFDVQWDRQNLVLCYPLNEVLILDFSHLFPV